MSIKIDTNHVIVIGRLTADVRAENLPNGTAKASFSIASNYGWKDQQNVNFFNVIFLGKIAEVCSTWLGKGKQVLIEGELRQDRWQDKTTGKNRDRVYIFGTGMQMLGSNTKATDSSAAPAREEEQAPPEGNTPPAAASAPAADANDDDLENSEVPF